MDRAGWNQRYEGSELVWTADPNQFLVAETASLTPGTALDLGAGEGRNAVWLAQQGWTVTAVDFAEVGLVKAEQMADGADVAITTVCTDVADYTPDALSFDLVVVLYLHLPADVRAVVHARAADAVAPGGSLLVVGHDATNITDGYGGPQDPDVLFSPDDVVADIRGAGLATARAERVSRTVTTADGERSAIDALVHATRPAASEV